MVFFGADGWQAGFVQEALRWDWGRARDGGDHLRPCDMAGNGGAQAGVRDKAAMGIWDWNEPTRALNQRGHCEGGFFDVGATASGVFEGVGESADFRLLVAQAAIAAIRVGGGV